MLELSFVPVPCHQDALSTLDKELVKKGFDIGILKQEESKEEGSLEHTGATARDWEVMNRPGVESHKLSEPIQNFKERTVLRRMRFIETISQHRDAIMEEIRHKEFFLDEFKKNQWNANPMLDRQRIAYSSQIDALKRELRSLDIQLLEGLRSIEKDILDADREIVPLKLL